MMLDYDLRLATFIHSYIEMAIKYFEPYSNPRYGVLTSNGKWRAERNRNRKFWVVCVPWFNSINFLRILDIYSEVRYRRKRFRKPFRINRLWWIKIYFEWKTLDFYTGKNILCKENSDCTNTVNCWNGRNTFASFWLIKLWRKGKGGKVRVVINTM